MSGRVVVGYVIPALVGLGMVVAVALLTGAVLVLSGVPDRYAACDDLDGRMVRSACVLPDGQYVDPLVYKEVEDGDE